MPPSWLDRRRRRAVRFEPLSHPERVALGLDLVVLELLQDVGIVRRRDHPVEHPQHVLLHRVRLVDVLDQLLVDRAHDASLDRDQRKPPELAATIGGAATEPRCIRCQDVDETRERRAVVQLQPDDVERHADHARHAGRPGRP